METGNFEINNRKYNYKIEDNKLYYEAEDNIHTWFEDDLKNINSIMGKDFDKNDIALYANSGIYDGVKIDYLIKYLIKKQDIKSIWIRFDGLDYFYDTSLIDEVEIDDENVKLKLNKESNTNEFQIKIKDYKMNVSLHSFSNYSLDYNNPIMVYKHLCINFDFNDNFDLIYDVILNVKKLFYFLTYSKNIKLNEIILMGLDESRNGKIIGALYDYDNEYHYIDENEMKKRHAMKYNLISNQFPTIFQNIIDDRIGPKTYTYIL